MKDSLTSRPISISQKTSHSDLLGQSVITGTTDVVTQFGVHDLEKGMGCGVAGGSTEDELHQTSARGDLIRKNQTTY